MEKPELERRLDEFFKKNLSNPTDWIAVIRHGSTCGFLNSGKKTVEKQTNMLLFLLKFTADTAGILFDGSKVPLFEEINEIQETYKSKLLELIEMSKKVSQQKETR